MIKIRFRLSIIIIIFAFLWQQLLWAGCDFLRPLATGERHGFSLQPKGPDIIADPILPKGPDGIAEPAKPLPVPDIISDPIGYVGPKIHADPLLHLVPDAIVEPVGVVAIPPILAQNLYDLNIEDWIAEDLLNEFAKLNNGKKLRVVKVQGNLAKNMSDLESQLKDIPDDEFICLIVHNKISEEEDGVEDRIDHRIVIDKAGGLKSIYGAIVAGGIKIGGLEYALNFSYYPKRKAIHLQDIVLGARHADILRGKGLMSGTFERLVELLRLYYPGLKISTVAISGVVAHWFIKYFKAKYISFMEELEALHEYVDIDWVDADKVMIGEITPPEAISKLAQTSDKGPQKPGEEPPAAQRENLDDVRKTLSSI